MVKYDERCTEKRRRGTTVNGAILSILRLVQEMKDNSAEHGEFE
jgi:hypothetical protein